jgi:DNA-binding transcriptional LysR family regulator
MPIPDLNLLRVLDVLLEERSVTRAGSRLGLSQSAVSHALNRLRHALNDELLVRGPSGMRPTPRAQELAAGVHAAMTQLQAALAPSGFDPATTQRRFNVVAGAYAASVLAPPIVAAMAAQAPGASLAVTGYAADLLDQLDSRAADFIVTSVVSAPERFVRDRILEEALVWTVSPASPLGRMETVDLAALAAVPHVAMVRAPVSEEAMARRGFVTRASWEDDGALERALRAQGLTRRIAVTMPDTGAALAVTSQSQFAFLAPRRLAHRWAQAGRLRLIDPPYECPPVDISLMCLRDRLQEPPIAWMRDQIQAAAAGL